jgi:hypothetical protein
MRTRRTIMGVGGVLGSGRVEDGALTEIGKVRETADRLANGESVEGGDTERVLAGLVAQLAAQVERLSGAHLPSQPGPDRSTEADVPGSDPADPRGAIHEAEMLAEEDRTPEDAPAEPLIER